MKALIAARPFNSIVDLNKFLLSQKLTQEQANQFYGKAFVHVNLNTGTAEEIMLIPGAGKRMAHEFEEYRPWRSWAQFQKEIGKYVNQQEVARLAQYTFIPDQHQHGERCRHPDHSWRRRAHAARVQGISSVEVDRAFPQGNRQIRRRQGSAAAGAGM